MEAIMIPVIVLGLAGIAMGLFLAFASKKFEVEVDPKVEQILAILPGINCGACGCPGCPGYASKIVEDGASMTLCTPGGPKVIEKIGEIMGVAVEVPVKKKKPAKKKKVAKPVATNVEVISASKEFIEKNKKMLEGYKEAFDGGDTAKLEKLEKLATMTKKEELLKAFEEIKAGKVLEAPAGAVNVQAISASKEFIDKNRKMLEGYKEAFDNGDKEKQEKLEKLATMTKKEELLKCFEEIKAGKVLEAPAGAGNVQAISASKEFIEKNKKMLEGYKEAFDNGDKEKQEKLEKLATMTKKEELLKCFEEIRTGKVLEAPAGAVSIQPISANKEFIEKNKKMLEGYKEAFDDGDKEKQEKLEKLATMTKKEELLKCFEEIKAGKIIPDISTMVSTKTELEAKKETSKEVKPKEDKKEQKQEEVVEKVKEEKAEQREMATEEEKNEQATSYCSVLGDGLCGVEVQGEMNKEDNPLTEILKEEKVEILKTEEKIEEEKTSASSNIYEYASHVSEIQEKLEPKEEIVEQKEEKIEPPKTEEEKLAEEQAASYCSVLGDGLCGVEIQEEVKDIKDTLEEKLTEKMD